MSLRTEELHFQGVENLCSILFAEKAKDWVNYAAALVFRDFHNRSHTPSGFKNRNLLPRHAVDGSPKGGPGRGWS